MKPGKRFGLSGEQKSDVWRRCKEGQTLHEIGRAFGKEHSSIRCLVSRHGGIAPAVRRRALLALTLREREEISRGLASGSSIREIAKCLERAVSTVSRGSHAMVDVLRIEPVKRTAKPGSRPCGPSAAFFPST
jgi:IS30 family transposase